MEKLYLLLGGNLGDKQKIFSETVELLSQQVGVLVQKSQIYETEPWGFESNDLFWNQALIIETELSSENCLQVIHQIEKQVGRIRYDQQYSSRIIDIDILFYGDQIIDTEDLQVPHPRMIDRKFVLVPLSEIASDKVHPGFGKTIEQLLNECSDPLNVSVINE